MGCLFSTSNAYNSAQQMFLMVSENGSGLETMLPTCKAPTLRNALLQANPPTDNGRGHPCGGVGGRLKISVFSTNFTVTL